MLSLEEIEEGAQCTHKNTGLRYSIVEVGEDEILLSPQNADIQDLVVPAELFKQEFVLGDRAPMGRRGGRRRGRGRRAAGPTPAPTGPRSKGRVKKMVRERGFGFIRGEDGKEVFFHRSGMQTGDYDSIGEGDVVEYVIQEGPRGARAEHVRPASEQSSAATA